MIDEKAFKRLDDDNFLDDSVLLRHVIEAYESARTAPTEGEVERVARAIKNAPIEKRIVVQNQRMGADGVIVKEREVIEFVQTDESRAKAAIAAMNPTPAQPADLEKCEVAALVERLGDAHTPRSIANAVLTAANVPFKE